MAQRKETKSIKVRDLKPKKDAKGGVATSVTTNRNVQSRQVQSRQQSQGDLHI